MSKTIISYCAGLGILKIKNLLLIKYSSRYYTLVSNILVGTKINIEKKVKLHSSKVLKLGQEGFLKGDPD